MFSRKKLLVFVSLLFLSKSLASFCCLSQLKGLDKFLGFTSSVGAFHKSSFEFLSDKECWVDDLLSPEFFDYRKTQKGFFFMQKCVVPPGSEVFIHGDIHASISFRSVIKELQQMGYLDKANSSKIIKDNFYMIFLGDYVDRGDDNIGTLEVLFRLKTENPERVFLLRGNHEDTKIASSYGFLDEWRRYGRSKSDMNTIFNLFRFMPSALFLGCSDFDGNTNYILCCHAVPDPGVDPKPLLFSRQKMAFSFINIDRNKFVNEVLSDDYKKIIKRLDHERSHPFSICVEAKEMSPFNLGFLWGDFIVDRGDGFICIKRGRSFAYGKSFVEKTLCHYSTPSNKVCGVIRCHQHSGAMLEELVRSNGVYKSWSKNKCESKFNLEPGGVYTVLPSPLASRPSLRESFVILTPGDSFENWEAQVCIL